MAVLPTPPPLQIKGTCTEIRLRMLNDERWRVVVRNSDGVGLAVRSSALLKSIPNPLGLFVPFLRRTDAPCLFWVKSRREVGRRACPLSANNGRRVVPPRRRACERAPLESGPRYHRCKLSATLLVHRLHNGAYDRGKDRAAASAAEGIAEKAAQRPARGRIGTRSPAEKGTKECASSDTADCTTNDFGQLAHRHLLQDRTDSLTAEDASNNLNNDRKNCFHVETPLKSRNRIVLAVKIAGRPTRSVKLKGTESPIGDGPFAYPQALSCRPHYLTDFPDYPP